MLVMSTTEFSDPNKIYKNPLHRRNDSGELDVFDAAMYFYGATEVYSCRGGIMSLQAPLRNASLSNSQTQAMEKPVMTKEEIKPNYKQPNSPGGRIAHFLNSIFNQTGSKKKKKSKSTTSTPSTKDHEFDESSPGGRRRRRSSISHFGSTAPIADPKPVSNSGFGTPPPYAITPTKAYKDLRSYSDHTPIYLQKFTDQYPCLDGKLNLPHACPDKLKNLGKNGIWDGKCQTENKELRKLDDHVGDDGGESDSSSDLFELENYDFGFYSSSGLPVYETTHVDSIKRGAPISNGAT